MFKKIFADAGEETNVWPSIPATDRGEENLGQEDVTTDTTYRYTAWIGWTGFFGPLVFLVSLLALVFAFYLKNQSLLLISCVGAAISLIAVVVAIRIARKQGIGRPARLW